MRAESVLNLASGQVFTLEGWEGEFRCVRVETFRAFVEHLASGQTYYADAETIVDLVEDEPRRAVHGEPLSVAQVAGSIQTLPPDPIAA